MTEKHSNKTIAKNTMFLYIRMMITMIISLYTSRVILQTLGVDDYGIYQAVGGIVGFMSFLNSALATGSSRFITYAIGEENIEKLKRTFSTVLIVHIVLAIIVALIAETIGLWYLTHKMVIPEDRYYAAQWVFHISIITAMVNITQVPFAGCITAHEKFGVYAYLSIIEATLKLGIVYLLGIGELDKMITYAILLASVQVGLCFYYRLYCRKKFEECTYVWQFDKQLFVSIAEFSGWNLFANITIALNNQGVLLLLNLFFSPAVVAARAISLQVDGVIKQFVNNFKTASFPQIVKRYAVGDKEGSRDLLYQTSNLAFFLMLILSVPVCMIASPLLHLWLGTVPEYTIVFLQLIVIQNLFGTLDSCFYQAFYASGRLKENAIASPTLNVIRFIAIYLTFKMGGSPIALSIAGIILNALLCTCVKPILMHKYVEGYEYRDILHKVFIPCFKTSLIAFTIPSILYYYRHSLFTNTLSEMVILGSFAIFSTLLIIWFIGLDNKIRLKLKHYIYCKFKNLQL